MKTYDNETLAKLQRVELEILRDFISLCDKYELEYFGIAGTCIGAIRHQGFIPWDDDIDIALPRDSYNKFISYAKKELSDKYTVMNAETNSNYPLMTTRLMLKNTKFRECALANIDCELGIFLDIYPFDHLSDKPEVRKKQMMKAFIYSKLLILRSIKRPVLGYDGFKSKLIYASCHIIHYTMKLLQIKKSWLYNQCLKASTFSNDEINSKEIDFLCDTTPYMNIWKTEDIYPLKKLMFEDIELNFPKNMHTNLTNTYGNYMELPSIEKRKNHFPHELEFFNE